MDMSWLEPAEASFRDFQDKLWLGHDDDKVTPSELWHYTPDKGFRGIVASRTLWVFDIDRLKNDPTEGKYSMGVLRHLVERKSVPTQVADRFRTSDTLFGVIDFWYQYVACFSEEKNSECQWRKYADDGKGFALGIDSKRLFEDALVGNYSYLKILYDKAEQQKKINSTIDHVINTARELAVPKRELANFWLSGRAAQSLLLSGLRIKDPGQENDKEREWRVLMLRADRGGAKQDTVDGFERHYLELQLTSDLLRHVMLGPNCEMSVEEAQRFLIGHGFPETTVERGPARAEGAARV